MIRELLIHAREELKCITDVPQLETEILLAHVLNKPRSYLYSHEHETISANQEKFFHKLIARRKNGEPIAYITGHREFWSLDLIVTPEVLIPRPETELLVQFILENTPHEKIRLADLGTGSGAIALALAHERPQWQIIATDQSAAAIQIAKQNAETLKLTQIQFIQGDWLNALASFPHHSFDLIVSNPPYIAENDPHLTDLTFEPNSALVSGKDGLDAIKQIIHTSAEYLKPNGMLLLEHGYQQGEAVRTLFESFSFTSIQTLKDLSGTDRATYALI